MGRDERSADEVGDEGGKALGASLAMNTKLRSLNLERNKVSSDGGKALAASLESNTALQALDLTSNSIGSEGGKALASSLEKNATLQTQLPADIATIQLLHHLPF